MSALTTLHSPLRSKLGVCQAVSAAYYFRNELPKKSDPGFMSMGDVGRLSWFFVCENIFFSTLLFFQNVYYHPSWTIHNPDATQATAFAAAAAWVRFSVEIAFVFLPYFWRPFFPKTALRGLTLAPALSLPKARLPSLIISLQP